MCGNQLHLLASERELGGGGMSFYLYVLGEGGAAFANQRNRKLERKGEKLRLSLYMCEALEAILTSQLKGRKEGGGGR